jgi:hypothetical protein
VLLCKACACDEWYGLIHTNQNTRVTCNPTFGMLPTVLLVLIVHAAQADLSHMHMLAECLKIKKMCPECSQCVVCGETCV